MTEKTRPKTRMERRRKLDDAAEGIKSNMEDLGIKNVKVERIGDKIKLTKLPPQDLPG